MEVDSMHSTIEKKLRNRNINVPADYVDVCKKARTNPFPYTVNYLNFEYFKKYSSLKIVPSIRPGKKSGDPTVNQIHALKYNEEGFIEYKLNFSDPWKILQQRIKPFNPIQLDNIPKLFETQPKISEDKFKHLQELKKSLKQDYHSFHDSLPH